MASGDQVIGHGMREHRPHNAEARRTVFGASRAERSLARPWTWLGVTLAIWRLPSTD